MATLSNGLWCLVSLFLLPSTVALILYRLFLKKLLFLISLRFPLNDTKAFEANPFMIIIGFSEIRSTDYVELESNNHDLQSEIFDQIINKE